MKKETDEIIYHFSDFSNKDSEIKLLNSGIVTLIEHILVYCKRPKIVIISHIDNLHLIQYEVKFEKVNLHYRLRIYFSNSLLNIENKVFDEIATKKNAIKAIDLLKLLSFRNGDSYYITLYTRKDEEYFESFYYNLRNLCKD